jgi:predicted ATPase
MAQIRVVKRALRAGKRMNISAELKRPIHLENNGLRIGPRRRKAGQNRDLQTLIQSRMMKSTKLTNTGDAGAIPRIKTTQKRIRKWHFHTQGYAITTSTSY